VTRSLFSHLSWSRRSSRSATTEPNTRSRRSRAWSAGRYQLTFSPCRPSMRSWASWRCSRLPRNALAV